MSKPHLTPLKQNSSLSSISSDEPILIESNSKAGPSNYMNSIKNSKSVLSKNVKNHLNKSKSLVTLSDEDEEEDDEPIFIGSTMNKLIEKYKLKSSNINSNSTKSNSRSISKSKSKSKSPSINLNFENQKSDKSLSNESIPKNSKEKSKVKIKIKTKNESTSLPLPLLPDLGSLIPLPVPEWLGKTSILLKLNNCAICKVRFKKTDSGAARWRHMSICRPPLFRPPNSPPNLKILIDKALRQQSKSSEPTSLLDLHVRKSNLIEIENIITPTKGNVNKNLTLGLKNLTSVKAINERDENWEQEIKIRLKEFIGDSSPPPPSPHFEEEEEFINSSIPTTKSDLDISPLSKSNKLNQQEEEDIDFNLPSTQTLGESTLAQIYSKPKPKPSKSNSPSILGSPSKSPITPTSNSPESQLISIQSEESDLPLPPPSQKRSRSISQRSDYEFNSSGDDDEGLLSDELDMIGIKKKPFRRWGDSRVDGNFSGIKDESTISNPLGWGGEDSPSTSSCTPQLSRHNTPSKKVTPESIHSTTPQARSRRNEHSVTPTPVAILDRVVYDVSSSSPEVDMIDDQWGDEAVISWEGVNQNVMQDEEIISVSSVAPSEVGLEEDEEEWGRDAYLEWAWNENDQNQDREALYSMENQVENSIQLIERGMPDYSSWELKKLQKLIISYGYRTSNDYDSLIKIAIDCWKALNPLSPILQKEKEKGKSIKTKKRIERDSSINTQDKSTHSKRKDKLKESGNSKEMIKNKITLEDLNKIFYKLIMDDKELWLRILRYEPINFDELISKSIANGIDKQRKTWKKDLKKYLDMQSISFFTEDPTGQRRRH
uniref:Structure-specific endonuclease subunit SLX4 n=1 Tax=Kwoniella pini CBS 10737 TaxID=1296096 RepID=A0A1B9HW69_9TREE|nr:uncharacterized protein I206_06426 [Kwoniella pini CBS 10737]OCF47525.1 hypothetical protein I206_06426 [Kwoniella pini CBS 10737]